MTLGRSLISRPHPFRDLFLIFAVWKTLIWLIAFLSPGIGYDTSSDLLFARLKQAAIVEDVPQSSSQTLLKFVRWDAIYFTEMARRGHVFEQEWAFGKGISTVLNVGSRVLGFDATSLAGYAATGILISHVSHVLSAFLLFLIASQLRDMEPKAGPAVPLIASILHIVSPAGIFLSAPYTESLFSFLNMLGFYLYIRSTNAPVSDAPAMSLIYKLLSGVAFALGTIVRGNGILSGIPFFVDAVETTFLLLSPRVNNIAKPHMVLQLQFTILGGCCIAAGLIYPQYIAYQEYCVNRIGTRPWCVAHVPSIFGFVQSHYWNVGFLRYWTLSNLPLFLLATPCLYLLIVSGVQPVQSSLASTSTLPQTLSLRIALPQLILALLALTSYHVQIITRLSSGYPMWYIWIASRMSDWGHARLTVRVLIMYGLIQAGLFASFLPPA